MSTTATRELLLSQVNDRLAAIETEGSTLDQFVELTILKGELDAAVRRVKDALKPRESELLDQFADEGVRSKGHGATGRTVYINRRIWARAHDGDKPRACEALQAAGLGSYVEESFNTNSLSAYFRELAKDLADRTGTTPDLDALLPEPLRGFIDLTEDHVLGVRS